MKYLLGIFTVMLITAAINGTCLAQQAKAYEVVHYTASVNNRVFKLAYADGYIAASNIKLKQGKSTLVFSPETGTPAANGDLVFILSTPDKGYSITLVDIDETAMAPVVINGTYRMNNSVMKLHFRKSK